MTDGERVRAWRLELGLRACDAARMFGYTKWHWSRIECDRAPVPPLMLYAMATFEEVRELRVLVAKLTDVGGALGRS